MFKDRINIKEMLSFNGVTYGVNDVVSISDLNREWAGSVTPKQSDAPVESRPITEKRPIESNPTNQMVIDPIEMEHLPKAYVLNPRVWAAENRSARNSEELLHTDLQLDAECKRQQRQISVYDTGYATKAISSNVCDAYCPPSTDARDLSTGYIPRVIIPMQKVLDDAVVSALSEQSISSSARKKGAKKTKQAELPGCHVFDSKEEQTVSILYTDAGTVVIDYSDVKMSPLDPTFMVKFIEEDSEDERFAFIVKVKSTEYESKLKTVAAQVAKAILKNREKPYTTEDSIRFWERAAKYQAARSRK